MLCAVDFISLAEFEQLAPAHDLAALSIGDPDQPVPLSLLRFTRALRMRFLDLEPADVDWPGAHGLFTRAQAARLVCFVQELHARNSDVRLVVHCHMGASRSAAVALVAHALTGCAFPRQQDAFYANRHVVALCAEMTGCQVAIPPFPAKSGHDFLPSGLSI